MFWKVPSYSQASPLEGILEKQHITLEELLDEEDLIQVPSCKTCHVVQHNFHTSLTQARRVMARHSRTASRDGHDLADAKIALYKSYSEH